MAVELIFMMHRERPYDVDNDGDFLFAESLIAALRIMPVILRDRGPLTTAKVIAKIMLRRCYYFGLTRVGRPISTGIAARGYCRFYPVRSDAIVLADIVTHEGNRGQGHATRAIMLAINEMIRRGSTIFYIDTQHANRPCLLYTSPSPRDRQTPRMP